MKLLLDTCTFLWVIGATDRLSDVAKERIADPNNEVMLSVVSVWEIALKHAMGRLTLPRPPTKLIPQERQSRGIMSLALDEESALSQRKLPSLHYDPFDRMLVCQALVHGLTLVTPDHQIAQYPVRVEW